MKKEGEYYIYDGSEPLPYINGIWFKAGDKVGQLIVRDAVYADGGKLVHDKGLFIKWGEKKDKKVKKKK